MNGELFCSISLRFRPIKMKREDSLKLKRWVDTKILFSNNFRSDNMQRTSNMDKDSTLMNGKSLRKTQRGLSKRSKCEHSMNSSEACAAWAEIKRSSRRKTVSDDNEHLPRKSSTTSKWMKSLSMQGKEKTRRNNGRTSRNRTSRTFTPRRWIERGKWGNLRRFRTISKPKSSTKKLRTTIRGLQIRVRIFKRGIQRC